MVFSGGEKNQHGVGIMMTVRVYKALQGYLPISDRVIMAKFEGKPANIVIVQLYAPTNDHSDDEVEEFYADVKKALKQVKSGDILIVMGDMNAKVGKEKYSSVVGKYGLGERNERGTHLINFCEENKLVIMNTFFKQHPRRLYTWKSPGDGYRNQIDYLMINERYKNSIKNAYTYPGADINSDHILLVMKMKLKLKIPHKNNRQEKADLQLLKKEDIQAQYAIEVKNRYDILLREELDQSINHT